MPPQFTILLVDDEPDIRRAIRRDLGPLGLPMIEAACGRDALDLLAHAPVDAVVSDYSMGEGEMSGLQLLERMRADHPQVLRVLLTGHADLHLALQALNRGVVHRFLTKPWEPRRLRAAIRQTIERASAGGPPRGAHSA